MTMPRSRKTGTATNSRFWNWLAVPALLPGETSQVAARHERNRPGNSPGAVFEGLHLSVARRGERTRAAIDPCLDGAVKTRQIAHRGRAENYSADHRPSGRRTSSKGTCRGRNAITSWPLNQLADYRLDWVLPPKCEELLPILGPRSLWDVHHHDRELRKPR